jgi:hypothetical protein
MRPVRIAYVVSAYKNPDHLSRLVHRLHTGLETRFLLHVDRKTDEATHRAMHAGVADLEHVHFLPRHACHWGGFGHVRASLKAIAELVRDGELPDYTILLSGQDYPIKSNAFIHDFLARGEGRSFFMHFSLPTKNWTNGGLGRFRDWHLRHRKLHLRLPLLRRVPGGLRPWGGSAYWMVSAGALRTIADFVDAQPEYVRFFKHVDIPDELFFQTILLNSPEAERCVDFRLHYTEWSRTPAPAVLTTGDFPQLAASSCLFARKFDEAVDEEVLDLVDERLLG